MTEKKLYESPTLIEYGDIQELTQGSGSGGFEVDSGGNTWPYKPS
ncbi:MAG: lasso RiPP family leader peptide-containing protein [Candidatus Poribacteria bacterium]|nr:lasso RiPP family leader peptide-containing protein [Candidatus Poribacteria bacterium]